MVKVLNVGEKPSIAKEVSRILSNGATRRGNGQWVRGRRGGGEGGPPAVAMASG